MFSLHAAHCYFVSTCVSIILRRWHDTGNVDKFISYVPSWINSGACWIGEDKIGELHIDLSATYFQVLAFLSISQLHNAQLLKMNNSGGPLDNQTQHNCTWPLAQSSILSAKFDCPVSSGRTALYPQLPVLYIPFVSSLHLSAQLGENLWPTSYSWSLVDLV